MKTDIEANHNFSKNCSDECVTVTQKMNKNGLILNTFLYLYLMKYFQNVEFYLNVDKVKDVYTKELFNKIKELHNVIKNRTLEQEANIKTDFQKELNGIKEEKVLEDEDQQMIFANVESITLKTYLLQVTKEENIEFPYILVEAKIEINVNKKTVRIKSSEYILIKKNWSFALNEVFDKKTCEDKEAPHIEIFFKKETTQEERQKIQIILEKITNAHCIFCECNFDTTKGEEIKETKKANLFCKRYGHADEKEKEIFKKIINSEDKIETDFDDIFKRKDEINQLLFSLYEPAFYNICLDKKNKICYKKIYDKFKKIMIRSSTLKMNKELIAYLLCEFIILPNYVKKNKFMNVEEDEYSSLSSYSKNSSNSQEIDKTKQPPSNERKNEENNNNENIKKNEDSNKVEENNETEENKEIENKKSENGKEETEESYSSGEVTLSETSDEKWPKRSVEEECSSNKKRNKKRKTLKQLFQNKRFRDILHNIQNEIVKFNNSVFLRVNTKNLRDGSFVNDYNLEVKTLYDALLMLKSATGVFKMLKRNKQGENYLIFSKYVNINICCLFDVYVYNNQIIALSQKYLNHYFHFLNDPLTIIDNISLIKAFFHTNLEKSFPISSYICQLYIHSFKKTHVKKVFLINAKSWIFKNKHPIFTNQFLKHYIYTGNKGKEVKDENFNKYHIHKYEINPPNDEKKEEIKKETEETENKKKNFFDFYCYDEILFFCITENDAIYKKNNNIYPKDMSYVRAGEIDIDKLMETMKKDGNFQ